MHVDAAATLLRATRIDVGLRRRLHGPGGHGTTFRVVSVHRTVVNVAAAGGRLVSVAADEVGGLPDGILVADAPDFTRTGIGPGMAAAWRADALHVPDASLAVRTRGAAAWSPRIASRDVAGWSDRAVRAQALAGAGRVPGGLADLPLATPALRDLEQAIRGGDRRVAAEAARRLIGLGPGLTPSGDDALAGIESGLRAASHPMAGFLAASLDDVDVRTTTVAAAMLRHAARGDAAERVHRLLDGLLAPDPDSLAPAIDAAVRWGATSGSDLLAGVLLGLDAASFPARRDRIAA